MEQWFEQAGIVIIEFDVGYVFTDCSLLHGVFGMLIRHCQHQLS